MDNNPKHNGYQQPYTNKHVISNTSDPSRSESPIYIRRFPRFLHFLYKRQIPYTPTPLRSPKPEPTISLSITKGQASGSQNTKTNKTSTPGPSERASQQNQQQQIQLIQQSLQPQLPPQGFKTLGKVAANNAANEGGGSQSLGRAEGNTSPSSISQIPSDFEHIFHYSETS